MSDDVVKKRILFVDDEPMILSALRNVFFRERARWEVTFAVGGEAALQVLADQSFDVVISDMRMPVVDGAMLLEQVRRDSPHTLRIMLSGSADADEVQRATGAVDELLCKPCDTRKLRSTIERLIATRDGTACPP